MNRAARLALAAALALAALAVAPAGSLAAAPAWTLTAVPSPTNLAPGEESELLIDAVNVGGAPTAGSPVVLEASFPPDLEPTSAFTIDSDRHAPTPPFTECTIAAGLIRCEITAPVFPGRRLTTAVGLDVSPAATPGSVALPLQISGGGGQAVARSVGLAVQAAPLPFGFTSPPQAPLVQDDGLPATLAGSRPYGQSVDFGFPMLRTQTEAGNSIFASTGHVREIQVNLPRGLIVNPTATPVRCTEAQLLGPDSCPQASQVGLLDLGTLLGTSTTVLDSNLYNMVPPPGYPAELATNAAEEDGIFAHILGGVRSESDFGLQATVRDYPALGTNPVFNDYTQLWGDPSAHAHDEIRGRCRSGPGSQGLPPCEVPSQPFALLTMPTKCPGRPLETEVAADSWEAPSSFIHASSPGADLQGGPVTVSGCDQLEFSPTISAQPTTNLADSPSGLDFTLHQPTDLRLDRRSPAIMRDAHVTLPAGMVANPSQADGLAGCSEAQIGYLAEDEEAGVHFSKQPASCPDAAKLGTVEVTTPLLAQYRNEGTELVTDPETGDPVPRPLQGSVYLAKPFQNPFGGLLAIYLDVEDPASGTVAKLAGRVEPDPATGQLTTVFEESPELPLEDVRLHLFGGARASLISPPTCGAHAITSRLTPWSAPEGEDAHPESTFQTSGEPGGGACPTSVSAAAHAPAFTAGTISRKAGAYSPFSLKLSREDGSARLSGLDTLLPPGLTGKLAGVAECADSAIAAAAARSNPEEGRLEREHPSCPASSQVGVVNVGAGAGPNPFYVQGHAYLAGPYKGAPLSLAIITPAIAGPFDLGTVVVRAALYVDPFTAQIRAVSDPFPRILDGIPLDIRSVALQMDRPDFTLNPTSCDPMAITGSATSELGALAPLNAPFQVGGCSSLGFKPSLTLKLKGGTKRSDDPSLTARLTYPSKGAYANIASAQVNLPHSEFLEQAHIGTVCTRPQLASHTCPAKSIYGHARAVTPLLDQPLEGPVYLGVGFGHKLPDLVADLNGQIEVLLHGKTDTGKNDGLRNTFQVVPDAPVSSFTLTLFGGKRGLIVNSENLCGPHAKRQAFAHFTAQNGAVLNLKPKVQNQCGKGKKGKAKRHGPRHRRRTQR